jgi:hypothetical protein
MKDRLWRCKDGRVMTVAQMETSHIKNAIALIQRSRGWRKSFLPRLEIELLIRNMGVRI